LFCHWLVEKRWMGREGKGREDVRLQRPPRRPAQPLHVLAAPAWTRGARGGVVVVVVFELGGRVVVVGQGGADLVAMLAVGGGGGGGGGGGQV